MPFLPGLYGDIEDKIKNAINKEKNLQKARSAAEKITELSGHAPSPEFQNALTKPGVAEQAIIHFETMATKERIKNKMAEEAIPIKAKETTATTLASEQAKLSPEITELSLQKRAQEKQQDLGFKAEEQFLDIQKQILQKGVDLDASEKQRLVFAMQGSKSVEIAKTMLNDQNFIGAVFQSGGGPIGKLSTAGNTQLRNYNTAIESGIVSYLFANSGAQASDKERGAFRAIYGAQIGDTLDNVRFKNNLLSDFFVTARDITDPNRVGGLSVTELKGKMNEIQEQMNKLGKGDSKEAKIIIQSLQERSLNQSSQADILKSLGLDSNRFELVEE